MSSSRLILSTLCFLTISGAAIAYPRIGCAAENQGKSACPLHFEYDLNFDMKFDNREFDRSRFQPSFTLFGARIEPYAGLRVDAGRSSHRLLAGVDVFKEFGSYKGQLEAGFMAYYNMNLKLKHSDFSLYAGMMPRRMQKGLQSPMFLSELYRFRDNRIEGLVLSWELGQNTGCNMSCPGHGISAHFELGCDWMGMLHSEQREEFLIWLSGDMKLLPWLKAGYDAYMHHYACSALVNSVSDDILAEAYIIFDFSSLAHIQALELKLGWAQALQRDRALNSKFLAPGAAEIAARIQHWGLGIDNSLTIGCSLSPYRYVTDAAGVSYDGSFNKGDAFYYLVNINGLAQGYSIPGSTSEIEKGLYDRLEFYWQPKIYPGIHLRASVLLHFNARIGSDPAYTAKVYSGSSQTIGIIFDLHDMMRHLIHK